MVSVTVSLVGSTMAHRSAGAAGAGKNMGSLLLAISVALHGASSLDWMHTVQTS